MGGLALLARELGHQVTGSDANVYPPMSTQLEAAGIELMDGYSADNLAGEPDLVVIGNAVSRGNPEVEAVLDRAKVAGVERMVGTGGSLAESRRAVEVASTRPGTTW